MLNRSASLVMSTSILKALTGKLDIKRHSSGILYLSPQQAAKAQMTFVQSEPAFCAVSPEPWLMAYIKYVSRQRFEL